MKFSADQIAKIVQGELIQQHAKENSIEYFCTDSRKIHHPANCIFVPIKTTSRDGHDFIKDAYAKGIRNFLCSDKNLISSEYTEATFIIVRDTLEAMQQLAAYHRSLFNIPVMAITGSNGKTIVKEWLSSLLSDSKKIIKNPKSFNSQLGVALSVSRINETHEFGVFEAGISQPNEMGKLQKMIQPQMGLFTMIGAAHGANFESTELKINEKLLLFEKAEKLYCCSRHTLVLQQITNFLKPKNPKIEIISWGENKHDQLQIISTKRQEHHTIIEALFHGTKISLRIPYTDGAYIENAIHCWLIMLDQGYSHSDIKGRFVNLPPISMRLELRKGIQSCTIINDSYSADLASLPIALDFLAEQKQHKKHSLIISDFAQQSDTESLYHQVSNLIADYPLHRLILIGEELYQRKELFQDNKKTIISAYQNTQEFLLSDDISLFQDEAILIKGARHFALEKIVFRLEQNIHRTVLNINLSALNNNINVFKSRLQPNTKIMAMVKAFSYGSGTYEVANALESYGLDYLAVAYIDEGILLRKKGVQLPILVLNPEADGLETMIKYQLEPEVYSIPLLQELRRNIQSKHDVLNIHIKLDTGMHRLGIEEKDLEQFLMLLKQTNSLKVKSVFSHLVAAGDASQNDFTLSQFQLFEKLSEQIEQTLGYKFIRHISNSGGSVQDASLQLDMVRLGIGLYGIHDHPQVQSKLQQIGRLTTSISQIKNIEPPETVGYNRAGVIKRKSRIATINIGYADGYSRQFGMGVGQVLIHNKLAPVVGNVCMDMTMVDVTDIPEAQEGSSVIIFGPELPVNRLAQWIDTIPYEIIAGISQRVKRVFYKE